MALLGHASTYIVSSPNPHASAEAWGLLGFDDAGSDASIIRMTDGQIFIAIIPDEGSGLSLAYFAPSLQSVRDKLVAAHVELTGTPTTDLCVHGCSTTWWIHSATPERMQVRTGQGSPLLGTSMRSCCRLMILQQQPSGFNVLVIFLSTLVAMSARVSIAQMDL